MIEPAITLRIVSGVRLEDFDYELPPARIAQVPVEPATRPGCWSTAGRAPRSSTATCRDLPELLRPGDLVVVNDTKVLPARLRLRRATGGAAEVLLLEPRRREPRDEWEALVRPGRRAAGRGEPLRRTATAAPWCGVGERTAAGDTFVVDPRSASATPSTCSSATARCRCRRTSHDRSTTPSATRPCLRRAARFGRGADGRAAPHRRVLDGLAARGVDVATVELVVGLDTFRPMTEQDPLDHAMHTERYRVPPRRGRGRARAAAAAPGRRGRHDHGAGARVRGRHRRAVPDAPTCSSTAVRRARSSTC